MIPEELCIQPQISLAQKDGIVKGKNVSDDGASLSLKMFPLNTGRSRHRTQNLEQLIMPWTIKPDALLNGKIVFGLRNC